MYVLTFYLTWFFLSHLECELVTECKTVIERQCKEEIEQVTEQLCEDVIETVCTALVFSSLPPGASEALESEIGIRAFV